MRWRSWEGAVAAAVIAGAIGLTTRAGGAAPDSPHHWLALVACVVAGLAALWAPGPPPEPWLTRWYAIGLCVIDPMAAVSPYRPWTPLGFALVLVPFAWAGVSLLGRRRLVWAVGAWLVLLGHYLALVYNAAHTASGIGVYSTWVS